jgi:acetoin utilization deacetylase AcuC-like enzyme
MCITATGPPRSSVASRRGGRGHPPAGAVPRHRALLDTGSGARRGFTIDLLLPAGSGEEVLRSLIEHLIVPVGLEFNPELVLISAGFDADERDPMGGGR